MRWGGLEVTSLDDLRGRSQVFIFVPESLLLVKGSPARRRAHLDAFAAALDPQYAAAARDLQGVLRQRNAQLAAVKHGADPAALDPWDAAVRAGRGGARAAAAATSSPSWRRATRRRRRRSRRPDERFDAAGSSRNSRASGYDEAALLEELRARRPGEVGRGLSLFGPHRDDLRFLEVGPEPGGGRRRAETRPAPRSGRSGRLAARPVDPDRHGRPGLRPGGAAARRPRPAALRVPGRAARRRPGAAPRGAAPRGGAHRPAGAALPRRRDERARRRPPAAAGAHAGDGRAGDHHDDQPALLHRRRSSPRRPWSSFRWTARSPPARPRRRRTTRRRRRRRSWTRCDGAGDRKAGRQAQGGAQALRRGGRRDDLPRRLGDIITPALDKLAGGDEARAYAAWARAVGDPVTGGHAAQGLPPRAAHRRVRLVGVGQRAHLPRPADPAAHGRGGAGAPGQALPLRRRPAAGRRGRRRGRAGRPPASPGGAPAAGQGSGAPAAKEKRRHERPAPDAHDAARAQAEGVDDGRLRAAIEAALRRSSEEPPEAPGRGTPSG